MTSILIITSSKVLNSVATHNIIKFLYAEGEKVVDIYPHFQTQFGEEYHSSSSVFKCLNLQVILAVEQVHREVRTLY